ncbi:MAG TPA: DUF3037 domain-containing protein [Candidatus Angelobacter sp.]|nr:DUF3037 domain-containing protein [Candidatus Angelobacter sp.]
MTQCSFFLLRYVPDAVKNEFVNIGVVLMPPAGDPELRFTHDWARVRCLDPQADVEMLEAMEADLRSQMRDTHGDRDALLRRMQDSFSNALQPSEFKACLAESPVAEADELARIYLERPPRRRAREISSRQAIYQRMRGEFERVGAWELMWRDIPAARFTRPGDPLKLDAGYAAGETIRMFHALSLEHDVNAAKVLGFSFPRMAEGLLRTQNQQAELTAIVEDRLPSDDDAINFALETLRASEINIASLQQLPQIANVAARELRLQ